MLPPPRIQAPAEIDARVGDALAFAVSASDDTDDVPALVLLDAPAGASLVDRGDGTREVRWTPGRQDVGEALLTFEAYRSGDDSARTLASTLVRIVAAPATPVAPVTPVTPVTQVVPATETVDVATVTDPDPESPVDPVANEPKPEPEPIEQAASESRFGEAPPLRELAARHGLRIGTATSDGGPRTIFTMPETDTWIGIATEEYDILTPENVMKMGEVQPERGRFEWSATDRLVDFAEAHGMAVHGHSLLWHQQVPKWAERIGFAQRRDEMRAVMREHVGALMSRYRGRVAVWDVVNEALEEDGQLRHGPWHNGVGPDYFGEAFRLAREFDPGAALIYNDYAIAWPGPKSDALLSLLREELAAGTPIDGVGFQLHLSTDFVGAFEPMVANLARFAELGLDIYVTELDVATDWRRDPDEEDRLQAEVYGNALTVCLEQPACRAFQTWGLSDRYAWRGTVKGLPFDEKLEPKPAFRALQRALRDVPVAPGRVPLGR